MHARASALTVMQEQQQPFQRKEARRAMYPWLVQPALDLRYPCVFEDIAFPMRLYQFDYPPYTRGGREFRPRVNVALVGNDIEVCVGVSPTVAEQIEALRPGAFSVMDFASSQVHLEFVVGAREQLVAGRGHLLALLELVHREADAARASADDPRATEAEPGPVMNI